MVNTTSGQLGDLNSGRSERDVEALRLSDGS